MSQKKVTPISLYYKDLKRQDNRNVYDMKIAALKFKSLSVKDKDRYEVAAKRINERNSVEVPFTTQRDTLGMNLKEISEIDIRRCEWERNSQTIISAMASMSDVLDKEYFAIKISGVDFCRSEDSRTCYATSEICFIKFSFMKGIIDKLILFPELVNVAAGYRQHLYEDLEENVGWKPETFRKNNPIKECIVEIRNFFNGIYEPIFVPTKDHQQEVGLALETLYTEIDMVCPWLESFDDWGKSCKIYQLEYLVASILTRNLENPNNEVSTVLDYWRKMQIDLAPETCERHLEYGLASQCATNILIKYLFGSFLIAHSSEMPNFRSLVSESFFQDLDFIMPMEAPVEQSQARMEEIQSNVRWKDYFYAKSGIEDLITSISGITINNCENDDSVLNYKKQVEWGRGRGIARRMENSNSAPGSVVGGQRKLKLPNVVC